MLQGDRRRLELAYSLMMSLPGTPVLRYGDEIGMGDNLQLPERNCARTPMQWSTEPNAGFTTHAKPITPVNTDGAYGFRQVNVAAQRRDPNSFLNWMERIIRMRKEVPEIGWGDFSFVPLRTPGVLAMEYEWRNNSVLFVHNLTPEPQEIRFKLIAKVAGDRDTLISLLSDEHSQADDGGHHCIVLEAFGYRWFRVGGLDYLLRRSEV
jgi:maltose alpha-D-glucosyltransferase/alpha-amylase